MDLVTIYFEKMYFYNKIVVGITMYKANYLFYQKYQKLLVDENKTTLTIFLCLNQKIVYKNTFDILKDGINDNINNIVVLNLIKTVLYIVIPHS